MASIEYNELTEEWRNTINQMQKIRNGSSDYSYMRNNKYKALFEKEIKLRKQREAIEIEEWAMKIQEIKVHKKECMRFLDGSVNKQIIQWVDEWSELKRKLKFGEDELKVIAFRSLLDLEKDIISFDDEFSNSIAKEILLASFCLWGRSAKSSDLASAIYLTNRELCTHFVTLRLLEPLIKKDNR